MNVDKKNHFVLRVELSGGTINEHLDARDLVNKIADSVESVSIVKYEGESDNLVERYTKEEFEDVVKKLKASTVICPTPLDRIALLHAFEKMGQPECHWASGARIIRRYRYDKEIGSKYLGGYDLCNIFEEILNQRSSDDTLIRYLEVLKKVSKDMGKNINELIEDSQEELLKPDGSKVRAKELITTRNPNPDGPFHGKTITFSNYAGRKAEDRYKKQAAHWAAGLGFRVNDRITKRNAENQLLVVLVEKEPGDSDTEKMKQAEKYKIPCWEREDFEKLVLGNQASDYAQPKSA